MEMFTQFVPFIFLTAYLALTIFVVVLAMRFVAAHERIASALDDAAHSLRRSAQEKRET